MNNTQQEINEALLNFSFLGKLQEVHYLLTSNELNKNAEINAIYKGIHYRSGQNALILACIGGHVDIVKYLLSFPEILNNINYKDKEGKTAIDYACALDSVDILETILNTEEYFDYNKALHLSCNLGKLNIVKYFLTSKHKHKFQLKSVDYHGKTPLMIACSQGHLNIVKFLLTSSDLEKNSNINEATINKSTSLMYACLNNQIEIIDYLLTSDELKEHSRIHDRDENQNAAIYYCETLETVKFLLTNEKLKEHADMYSKNKHGYDIFSRSLRRLDIMEFLIFDMNIDTSKYIDFLQNQKNVEPIFKMIKTKHLHQHFEETLNHKNPKKMRKI